ncbi:PREDICTED: probable LRR receptor-like serine/threonine-protein kinase PAM74 isoform X2 [Tarenaya hassleriana]|uniref:probable LRR receptor-like serine/threonine-protein kinase PAM74 isoform X2 n=1 Tax=Tarenaya hassleriana TaxID=28532 RepID=UPI00053C35D8|nr:PREDICTED: probable LRR receptor-like serine/threonine-protein kinase PAM74 isoform X2 [Tarenaya hassleriana]
MSLFIFLLWSWSSFIATHAIPSPRGFFLNCGSSSPAKVHDINYNPDEGFIAVGNTTTLNQQDLLPILSTLRYFPNKSSRKYCYSFPVSTNSKYLIRTTYYYGNFDGRNEPPVFDQIVGEIKWSVVNTTEDYANGLSSYYEIIVASVGKTLSVCLAKNAKTVSSPFISALEVQLLEDSMYNSTDLGIYALNVITRSSFGGSEDDMISYPDDQFNRLWQPFSDPRHPTVKSHGRVDPSDFWNVPPAKAFASGVTASKGKILELSWPPFSLPTTKYYVALYFQDNRNPSPLSWRVFDVFINGVAFYSKLNVSANGAMVYTGGWPLSGQTRITMVPMKDSPVGPVINAAEVFQIVPLGGKTHTRDATAMHDLSRSIMNLPSDWSGDPCLPHENSWTGVTCSKGLVSRVTSLNLTNLGLAGSLPSSVNKMTALKDFWIGKNKLTGTIPDLSLMKRLETLYVFVKPNLAPCEQQASRKIHQRIPEEKGAKHTGLT